jgi:HTH-type transcriptional regulator / antitoxin HipB
MKKSKIKKATSYDELVDIKYGKQGTPKRDNFEDKANHFVMNEMMKAGKKKTNK